MVKFDTYNGEILCPKIMKKVMATRNFFNQAMTQQKISAEKSHAYIGKYSNIFVNFMM